MNKTQLLEYLDSYGIKYAADGIYINVDDIPDDCLEPCLNGLRRYYVVSHNYRIYYFFDDCVMVFKFC